MPMRRSPVDDLRLRRVFALAAVVAVAASCATGPRVGVRPDYRDTSIRSASVTPFFTRSSFSLSADELDRRLTWAEQTAGDWLMERGVEIDRPKRTRRRLESSSEWGGFAKGGIFRVDLSDSFESAARPQRRDTQRERLRRIGGEKALRRFVLLGELLYQTSGTCRTRADEHSERAHVVVAPGTPEALPRPCIVTHFQARLMDAETGATVWFNRRLREIHVPEVNETWIEKNIRQTVRATLTGDKGLEKLVSTPES